MSKVKVLYVKNLTAEVTEEKLQEIFGAFGTLERVKKIKVVLYSTLLQAYFLNFILCRTMLLFILMIGFRPSRQKKN